MEIDLSDWCQHLKFRHLYTIQEHYKVKALDLPVCILHNQTTKFHLKMIQNRHCFVGDHEETFERSHSI